MTPKRNVCAVVPAAGRGFRAGLASPKVLATLDGDRTVWSVLRDRLAPHVERIAVVLSPEGAGAFVVAPEDADRVRVRVQDQPLGMGDAVFRAEPEWEGFHAVLVVWGDQLGVSAGTIERAVQTQLAAKAPTVTLPLVDASEPYVQYDFDDAERLIGVRQSREGDACDARGLCDVGCFCLSSAGLGTMWREFVASGVRGARSGELNFLPFFAFLAARGWNIARVTVADPDERRGINTPEELAYFRDRFRSGRGT